MADAGCRICGDEVLAHGLCQKHYQRKRRTGDVFTQAERREREIADRDRLLRGAHAILRLQQSEDEAQAWVTEHMKYRLDNEYTD